MNIRNAALKSLCSQKMPVIEAHDFIVIGTLIFLEGVLSIDNALALALIARELPKKLQRKALMYGLIGAFVFRILALTVAQHLMTMNWVKFVGGGYLIFMAISHWVKGEKKPDERDESSKTSGRAFWKVIVLIELTDMAFAADSILAAVALSDKLWIVITGGLIGLVLMRVAANVFIQLLERWPNFEFSAYALVFLVGAKLVIDGFKLPGVNFHSTESPAFWTFWALMLTFVLVGFLPKKKKTS